MKTSLRGPDAKVVRARKQILTLDNEIVQFLRAHRYSPMLAEFNRATGRNVLRAPNRVPELPDEWAAVIGEVSHGLRSTLDNLVCQLARISDPTFGCDKPRTAFPICLRGPRSGEPRGRFDFNSGDIKPLGQGMRERIERAQPYRKGRGHRRSPLWQLHEISNADKHRLGLMTATHSRGIAIVPMRRRVVRLPDGRELDVVEVRNVRVKVGAALTPGAKIGEIGPGQLPGVDVDIRISPRVVFGPSCRPVAKLPVIATLSAMADEVAAVLEIFRADFEG